MMIFTLEGRVQRARSVVNLDLLGPRNLYDKADVGRGQKERTPIAIMHVAVPSQMGQNLYSQEL